MRWEDKLHEIEGLIKSGQYASVMPCVEDAFRSCRDAREKRRFAGLGSAPARPEGLARLADYAVNTADNTALALDLLNFIEQRIGTSVGLSEVWLSTTEKLFADHEFGLAKQAFLHCRGCQSELVGIPPRVRLIHLFGFCWRKIIDWKVSGDFDGAISGLTLFRDLSVRLDVAHQIDFLIQLLRSTQRGDQDYLVGTDSYTTKSFSEEMIKLSEMISSENF